MMNLSSTLKKRNASGFTIVELVIIIVVIAVLATIVIVAYNGISGRARDAIVKGDTNQSAKKMTEYKQRNGSFPSNCSTAGVKVSSGNTLVCNVAADNQSFCVGVSSQSLSYYTTNTLLSPTIGTCSGSIGVTSGNEHTEVSARGIDTTCGIKGGKAYCWGENTSGQLGDGTFTDSNIPVAVSTSGVLAGKTVTKIAAGTAMTGCAIANGAPYCWGEGTNGTLGNGASVDSNVPVAVTMSGALAGRTVTDIEVGLGHVCAIASGQLFCWGYNYNGTSGWSQFGVTTPVDSNVPVAVSNTGILAGKTITHLSLDGYGGPNCVVADGAPYCWGYGTTGGLGNGANLTSNVPVAVNVSGVLAGKTITDITTYEYHSCVVASGAAYCWGGNGSAQLGKGNSGTGTDSNVPVAVTASGVLAGKTVTAISAGDYFTCAIADAKAYCWGDNAFGTLGDGSATSVDALTPVAVSTSGVLAGKNVTSISAGYGNVCAIADNLTHCWGVNWSGSLGNASAVQSGIPVLTQF